MVEEETMSSDEFLATSEYRGMVYGFLSSIYIQSPSRDFVNRLLGKEVCSLLSKSPFSTDLPREMENGLEDVRRFIDGFSGHAIEEVHRDLSVDYARLFRGVRAGYGPSPPYESLYRHGERALMGRPASEVQRRYAEAGVSIGGECNELPDHIALELDFMRFLAEEETESWRGADRDNAIRYLNLERNFLREHIMEWVPGFCERVADMAEFDFYRGIARMTKGFVVDDYETIGSLIALMGR